MRTLPPPDMTCGFLIQLVFCKKTMWFIGVEAEQETTVPPPKKNPGSAPVSKHKLVVSSNFLSIRIVLSCFYQLIFYFENFST